MKRKASKPHSIYATVFVTGAATLVIEIAATRILSPHFGLTLFTISSILSVILAALSFGYWAGGKYADKHPQTTALHGVILVAGAATLLTHILNISVLPVWGALLDTMTGPLIASLFLFFSPAFFLGMVSPIAIRLQAVRLDRVGETAGKIFFYSTVGSISGSLLAGFVLIPHFSISQITIGTSLVLVGTGLQGLLRGKRWEDWVSLIVAITAAYLSAGTIKPPLNEAVLYQENSMYQHISVLKEVFAKGEGRLLMLDKTRAGAGYTGSDELPFTYTRYHRLYEVVNPDANRFLYLGGGAYTTPKKLLSKKSENISIDVVEIDPALVQIAKQYFDLPEDSRLTLITADAREYLTKTNATYDMIFIDVFSMDVGIPHHLMTQEFFALVKNHLETGGTVIMNVIATIDTKSTSLGLSAMQTFRRTFPQSEFITINPENLSRMQNIIFWAVNDTSWQFEPNDPRIAQSNSEEIRSLDRRRIDLSQFDMKSQIYFTDDFAPIEYLVAKMIKSQLFRVNTQS